MSSLFITLILTITKSKGCGGIHFGADAIICIPPWREACSWSFKDLLKLWSVKLDIFWKKKDNYIFESSRYIRKVSVPALCICRFFFQWLAIAVSSTDNVWWLFCYFSFNRKMILFSKYHLFLNRRDRCSCSALSASLFHFCTGNLNLC